MGVLHKSIKDGKWSSSSTWDVGTVPGASAGDTVEIYHRIRYDDSIAAAKAITWVKIIGAVTQAELYFFDTISTLLSVTGAGAQAGIQLSYTPGAGVLPPKLTINNNNADNVIDRHCITQIDHVGNTGDAFMNIDSRCEVHLEGIDIPESATVSSNSSNIIYVEPGLTGKWIIGDTLYYHRGNHYGARTVYSSKITNIEEWASAAPSPGVPGRRYTKITLADIPAFTIYPGEVVSVLDKSVKLGNTITSQCGMIDIDNQAPTGLSVFQGVQLSKLSVHVNDRGIKFIDVTASEAVDFRANNFKWDGGAVYKSTFYRLINCWLLNLDMFGGVSADSLIRESVGLEVSGRIFCNYNIFTESDNLTITADMMFNYWVLNQCHYVEVHNSYFYGNERAVSEPARLTIYDSVFGYNRLGEIVDNYSDISGDVVAEVVLKNVKPPYNGGEGFQISLGGYGRVGFEDEDGVYGCQRTEVKEGVIHKTPAPGQNTLIRRGGGATSALVLPGAYCSRQSPLTIFEYFIEAKANIERQFVCYVIAGEIWPATLLGADASDPTTLTQDSTLWLEAEYYDSNSLLTHSRKYSIEEVVNSDPVNNYWMGTPLTVKVTPGRDGVVRLALKVAANYINGELVRAFVVVDPRIIIV